MGHSKKVAPQAGAESVLVDPAATVRVQCPPTDARGEQLRIARMDAASDFSKEIAERWRKNQSCSRQLLADRYVHVNESIVKKWATGEKPIPLAALELLPEDLAVALVKRIFARRGVKL